MRRSVESTAERVQHLAADQQRHANLRACETDTERTQRLAANQQREAIRRASESEAEHLQHLAANQQREASRRASESEAEWAQRLANGQQQEADRRASESDSQRAHRLSGNAVEERQQRRENDHIIATRRKSVARQSIYDRQREAVEEFRQNICTGPFNPCYCCTRLCYNNGGSFIDANDSLLLPVHDRELSNLVPNVSNSVWICSQCKSSLKKHKLPPFASVNNMHVPPVPSQLSCLNSMERQLISLI